MLALGDASPWGHSPSSVVVTDQLAHTKNSLGPLSLQPPLVLTSEAC